MACNHSRLGVLAFLAVSVVTNSDISSAQEHDNPIGPQAVDNPDAGGDVTLFTTPTTLDRIGRIVAPVMINNRGPFSFVLDTGANQSVLSAATVRSLELVLSPEDLVEVHGVTGVSRLPFVSVQTLKAGALNQEDLRLPVAESVMGGAHGILGVDGFKGLKLVADFQRRRLDIVRAGRRTTERGYFVVPVRLHHGRLMITDVTVENVKAVAIVDTGAERTLGNEALMTALSGRIPANDGDARTITVEGVTAANQMGNAAFAQRIRLAGVEISDVEIIFGGFYVFDLWELQSRPAILIGMDVLGVLDVLIIDYRNKQLQLKPRINAHGR